jgi:hypothetical protein
MSPRILHFSLFGVSFGFGTSYFVEQLLRRFPNNFPAPINRPHRVAAPFGPAQDFSYFFIAGFPEILLFTRHLD